MCNKVSIFIPEFADVHGVTIAPAAAGPVATQPIQTGDVRLQIDAAQPFSSYGWKWDVECANQVMGAENIPETGILSQASASLGVMRFGKVADPDNASRKVLQFQANKDEPYDKTSSAPRCELTFAPGFAGTLPVGQDFWFGFGVRLQDWGGR